MSDDNRLKLSRLRRASKLGGETGKSARKVMKALGKSGVDKNISKKGVKLSGPASKKGTLAGAISKGDFKSKAAKKAYSRKLGKYIDKYQKSGESSASGSTKLEEKIDKRKTSQYKKARNQIRDEFGGAYRSDTGPSRDTGASSSRDIGASSPRDSA